MTDGAYIAEVILLTVKAPQKMDLLRILLDAQPVASRSKRRKRRKRRRSETLGGES